jgi:S1-C subfamily serine protease
MTMRRALFAFGVVSALALSACTNGRGSTAADPRSFPSPDAQSVRPTSIEQVVKDVLPAVVNVVATSEGGEGEGSGFIVRDDGIVVTNYHVVEGASSVTVLTSDEDPDEYSARVIGGDIQADLAILDIDAQGLPTVPLGDSEGLRLGQQVVAIGYAFGLDGGPSVTAGIVSSLAREITVADPNCPVTECGDDGERVYTDTIQTDAAINPGNSGGPLVDLAGNVVGINSAGADQAENVGFAIQIDSAKPTIFQAAEDPDAPVAFMGISSTDVANPEVQFELDPPVDAGALIVGVVPGGPADDAGVAEGDIVVEFDGASIETPEDLGEAIRAHTPGDEVEVVLVREGGDRVTVTIELGVNPVPLG